MGVLRDKWTYNKWTCVLLFKLQSEWLPLVKIISYFSNRSFHEETPKSTQQQTWTGEEINFEQTNPSLIWS